MSTSAYIITKHGGYFWAAYSHWDGYLAGLGSDLLSMIAPDKDSSTIEQDVFNVVKEGDMSYLGKPYNDDVSKPLKFKSLKTMLRKVNESYVDYIYLYTCGQWYVARRKYEANVIDFYRLSLFFKGNLQEFRGVDYQEHIFRDKTPDSIVTIRNK